MFQEATRKATSEASEPKHPRHSNRNPGKAIALIKGKTQKILAVGSSGWSNPEEAETYGSAAESEEDEDDVLGITSSRFSCQAELSSAVLPLQETCTCQTSSGGNLRKVEFVDPKKVLPGMVMRGQRKNSHLVTSSLRRG